MQCNIDSKGKAVRLIWGLVMLAVAVVLTGVLVLGLLGGWWLWAVAGALALMGAFGVFEARAGWCAVRAMGFKTPV